MKNRVVNYSLMLSVAIFNITSCSKSDSTPPAPVITPPVTDCSGTPGALFTAVKTIVSQKCVGCHNANNKSGGRDFSVDCNIVAAKTRIKVRAVDEGTMPPGGPLTQAEKDKITAWVAAGGLHTN